MNSDVFLSTLRKEVDTFTEAIATEKGDWIIKGFIDVYKRIYTVSVDTKVISKVMELLLIPKLIEFGFKNGYKPVLAQEQNFYPDISFVSETTGEKYAVDIKSTYRVDAESVNGMTLGAFTGYFHDRSSQKNITFSYDEYEMHIVLGIIYSKCEDLIDERLVYVVDETSDNQAELVEEVGNKYLKINSLEKISSVVTNFLFFVQPKYKIAGASPGSGNTKNIGSVRKIDQLIHGRGPFAELGEAIYDDYWLHYLTDDMARKAGTKRPYNNLKTYFEYKRLGANIDPEIVKEIQDRDTPSKDEV